MPPNESAGVLVATLGIQLQLAASLLCLGLGLLLRRGIGDRPWMTWWAASYGATAVAVAALLFRYNALPMLPLDSLDSGDFTAVRLLYVTYSAAKVVFLCCLLAGTWIFVTRQPIPAIGLGAASLLVLVVTMLFALAPADLNRLMAWQAGVAVPIFLSCGWLLFSLPPPRRSRGSGLLALVFMGLATLWALYIPGFLQRPDLATFPGRALQWVVSHNSFIDTLFQFVIGFGMIVAVLDDVSWEADQDRAARLRQVAASEARLAQIIRAASDGIMLLDHERKIAHANPAAEAILGCSEAELLQQPFDRFTTVGAPDPSSRGDPGGPPTPTAEHELVGRRADGSEFPMEISIRSTGDSALTGFVLIVRDRTQRVRAEAERQHTEAKLAQAARLEIIGRMVSGVAHELNNPLTAILAFSQDMLGQSRSGADREALTTIVQQSERCRAIVQDLLTFARDKRDDREPIAPIDIVRRVLPALERQAAAQQVSLIARVAEGLPHISVNASSLEQVLTNLIVNALQAVTVGGTVTLRSEVDTERLSLIVEDDGPGLAAEVLPQLFEPFFTTKVPGKGTGLGLSVSHSILEQHGGTLRAENRTAPERGARFTASLPYLDRRSVPRSRPALPVSSFAPYPAEAGRPGRRVLIVDDEAPIRVAIRRFLERRGWTVEEAGDGTEALELLGLAGKGPSRAHYYDVIVTDLKMPGESGIEIHDRLAADSPASVAKLILITGDTASGEVAEFVRRMRQPLVQKPFDMRTLADLLDRTAAAAAR